MSDRKEEGRPARAGTFEEAYRAYFNDVLKLVLHKISNRHMAEDIAQDTFIAAFKKGKDFLEHPEPMGWLICTAQLKLKELYRRMRRRATEPLEEDGPEMARQEERYGEIELDIAALAALSEEEWRMVKSYYLSGVTIAEIAKAEAITENNARMRIFRIRKKLQDRIER